MPNRRPGVPVPGLPNFLLRRRNDADKPKEKNMSENITPETENEDIEVVAHREDEEAEAGSCIINHSHEM
ncbi:hypothetical protein Slala02_09750 [Streptomyces lavendulae subsp. lavendulae]|nr:hypothetical protein Slala01_01790 [Streptomyces lavendulae subsp. lavendulae]GLX25155.1 hypothetical protein Slala02_09750 [Streptomyces lavendulae subsp. lavendulae]